MKSGDMMPKIYKFSGENRYLSNFYSAVITFDKRKWMTTEHAYQAMKTDDKGWQRKIQKARTAGEAKRLGRLVPMRKDWESRKYGVMKAVVKAKFLQHPGLRRKLLDTGDIHLEEGNTWGDKIWGTVNGVGKNWLGKILMEVRAELRREFPERPKNSPRKK